MVPNRLRWTACYVILIVLSLYFIVAGYYKSQTAQVKPLQLMDQEPQSQEPQQRLQGQKELQELGHKPLAKQRLRPQQPQPNQLQVPGPALQQAQVQRPPQDSKLIDILPECRRPMVAWDLPMGLGLIRGFSTEAVDFFKALHKLVDLAFVSTYVELPFLFP